MATGMIRALPPYILQTLSWPLMRGILAAGNFKVRGLEHLRQRAGPFIFAGNHASEVDVVLITAAIPFFSALAPIFYTAKKREFYEKRGPVALLYGGAFFKLWGAYPVREGLKNYKLSLNIHTEMLKKGKNLLIFPEGGVSPDGEVKAAHGGVAYLAHATDTPVIPVAINGTHGFSWKNFFLKRSTVTVTFGAPLSPSVLFDGKQVVSPDEYKEAAEKIMSEVKKLQGS